jgi:hypothetical protein
MADLLRPPLGKKQITLRHMPTLEDVEEVWSWRGRAARQG